METNYNTKGAAKYLGCGVDNIHKLVLRGRLTARKYSEDGILTEWKPKDQHRGQGLYFLQSDLDEYQRTRRGPGKPRKESA